MARLCRCSGNSAGDLKRSSSFVGTAAVAASGASFPIAEIPAAGDVDNLVIKCLALRHRHAPFGGGGAFEHESARRARLAQGGIEIADRFRPVGILVAYWGSPIACST